MFDADQSGALDLEEIATLMRAMGTDLKEEELQKLIDEVDADDSGQIEWNEFITLMLRAPKAAGNQEEKLRETLNFFDKDGSGKIEVAEWKHVMTTLGERLTDQDVDEMLAHFEIDEDGMIICESIIQSWT